MVMEIQEVKGVLLELTILETVNDAKTGQVIKEI